MPGGSAVPWPPAQNLAILLCAGVRFVLASSTAFASARYAALPALGNGGALNWSPDRITQVRQVPAIGETGRASDPGGGSHAPWPLGRLPCHRWVEPSRL